jgi:hypothetical protein
LNRQLTINLKQAAWVLALAVVFVDGLSACFSILNYFMLHWVTLSPEAAKEWTRAFLSVYVDGEYNFPTWYASFTILICAGLLGLIAYLLGREKAPYRWQWASLAVVFTLMALDEYVGFHEEVGVWVTKWLHPTGIFFFAWVIPGVAFVGVVGLAYIRFILVLPPRTRNLLILSAVLYVGGALGVEALSGYYVSLFTRANVGYELLVYVEETMEMAGIALFTYTLLDYLTQLLEGQPLQITIH